MNSVTLGGRLQNIISYHVFTTRNGKPNPSLIFSMYARRPFKDRNGQYQNDFFNVVYSGRGAQYIKQYGQKGGNVNVHGRIQNHTYNHTTTDQIIADEVELPRPSRNTGSFTTRPRRNGGNRPQQPNAPQGNMPRTNNGGFNRGAGAQNGSFNNRMNNPAPNNAPTNNRPMTNQPNNQGQQPPMNNQQGQPNNQSNQPANNPQGSAPSNPSAPNGNANANRLNKKPLTPDGKDLPF